MKTSSTRSHHDAACSKSFAPSKPMLAYTYPIATTDIKTNKKILPQSASVRATLDIIMCIMHYMVDSEKVQYRKPNKKLTADQFPF